MTPLAAPGMAGPGARMGSDPNQRGNAGRGLTPLNLDCAEGARLMTSLPNLTPPRTTIRKIAGRWLASCSCGFTWHTRWHRLALLMAVNHHHEAA